LSPEFKAEAIARLSRNFVGVEVAVPRLTPPDVVQGVVELEWRSSLSNLP